MSNIKKFVLGVKSLDTKADDSANNISRNRVSFIVCDSDNKDQSGLSKLSSIISNKMSNTSGSEVCSLILSKNYPVQYKNMYCLFERLYVFYNSLFKYLHRNITILNFLQAQPIYF